MGQLFFNKVKSKTHSEGNTIFWMVIFFIQDKGRLELRKFSITRYVNFIL